MSEPTENEPQPARRPGDQLAGQVVGGGVQIVIEAIRGLSKGLEWKTVLPVCTMVVALFALVPPEQRAALLPSLVKLTHDLFTNGVLPWVGWGLAALLVVVGTPYVLAVHSRLKSQGEELAKLRDAEHPPRLSSNNAQHLDVAARKIVDGGKKRRKNAK